MAKIKEVKDKVYDILKFENIEGKIFFHIYGKNGVMGDFEPTKKVLSHEIGIILEAVSSSQEKANTICSVIRSTLLHYGYSGRISTAGNLAFPFSPSDIETGEVFEFSIYHLMEIQNQDIFKLQVIDI